MHKYISLFLFTLTILFNANSTAKLATLAKFGDNPGELSASYLKGDNNTLIVLLHGCVQQGKQLAQQSGLMALANKKQFSILIPQQSKNNNIKVCFNWFSLDDIEKNKGESLSIKNMIEAVNTNRKYRNIYIIGLSAGGAMASSMLVNYPEIFSAGAIIAGVPYTCANNLITAIACMRSGPSQNPAQLTQAVREINSSTQQWPSLSIWTGAKDTIVNAKNSKILAKHWVDLTHATTPSTIVKHAGYNIRQWMGENKQVKVELIEIDNMDHGIAVAPHLINGGSEGAFVIKAPVSTMLYLLDSWGI